jgi:general secretion pathway protein H
MWTSCSQERISGLRGLRRNSLSLVRSRRGLTILELSIVVLLVSMVLFTLVSITSRFSRFKSTEDEGTILRDSLVFARSTAITSNEPIFFEFNLDEETYRAYRKESKDGEIIEKDVIKQRNLSAGNSLIGMQVGSSNRETRGKIVVRLFPEGSSDELAVFMGSEPEIKATVLFSRYGKGEVAEGEKTSALEDPSFRENLEEW